MVSRDVRFRDKYVCVQVFFVCLPTASPSFAAYMKVIIGIAVLLLVFLALQFWNPRIDQPPVTGRLQAPPEVAAILNRACADCHSNVNRLHWYDKIAPASWLVNGDIREARSRYNLSTWDSLKPADQQGELWEMVNMIINGKMPLGIYTAIHRNARVSPREIEVLKAYLASLDRYKPGDTALVAAGDREFAEYVLRMGGDSAGKPGATGLAAGRRSHAGLAAADGVHYIDGFSDWQVISTTNRFDNHSIRIVFGNALVVKAIRDGRVRSFPDGSVIVKAVWNSIEDGDGHVSPGTVNSIQLMVKDEKRFPETEGWGFAKFNGVALMPYGATAAFNTTCFNCHKMASDFGYVFNIPPTREIFDAGELRVITSFADNRRQTLSTLYGNEAARRAAVSVGHVTGGGAPGGDGGGMPGGGGGGMPRGDGGDASGASYTLVTWKQIKNTFWYGSQINGPLLSVERVTLSPASQVVYEVLKGAVPTDSTGHVPDRQSRLALIVGRRASVLP